MRFQSLNYIKYLLPLSLFLVIYFQEFYLGYPAFKVTVFLCFWIFILTTGALTTSEGYEAKNRGYSILGMLPLTHREIVAAKFVLLLAAVVVMNLVNLALLCIGTKTSAPVTWPGMVMIGILWGVFCLLYCGCMYLGIFKFGYEKVTRFHWVVFLALVVGLVFIVGDILGELSLDALLTLAQSPLGYAAALLGLAAFYLLYRTAVGIKEKNGEV